jgi:hypothetical protein
MPATRGAFLGQPRSGSGPASLLRPNRQSAVVCKTVVIWRHLAHVIALYTPCA